MPQASWNGARVAASEDTVIVEGNHYFPPASLEAGGFQPSATTTVCPWKGTASYFSLVVNGETNRDAAWYYVSPEPRAAEIRGRVAFWKGVQVEG